MAAQNKSPLRILLFWPNIVGYIRLILLFWALSILREHPLVGISLAILCSLFDGLDGLLARWLNQKSSFGAILDYTIDRVSVAIYLFGLTFFYSAYWPIFCFLFFLDISSHLFHLYLSQREGKSSHKQVNTEEPWILRFYYTAPLALLFSILFHDLFICFLYLHRIYPESYVVFSLILLTLPGFIFKNVVHIAMLVTASVKIAKIDQEVLST